MVLIVIWKTVSRPCCTLICFVSSFSNSSIFLTSTLRSIAKEMSLKHISLFLINFAVANSWCSLIGWKAAKRVPSRHQEPLLSVIVPAVMIGIKIANRVHHITYLRNPLFLYNVCIGNVYYSFRKVRERKDCDLSEKPSANGNTF